MRVFLTRRGFDELVSERLPEGRRTRKETGRGWRDTIEVGFLRVTLEVCDVQSKARNRSDVPFNHIRVQVRAVRETIDGSDVVIWQQQAGVSEAEQLLDDLRARLLGVALDLLVSTGARKKLNDEEKAVSAYRQSLFESMDRHRDDLWREADKKR